MTNLTEAEKAHGWTIEMFGNAQNFDWRGEVWVSPTIGIQVCVSADSYDVSFEHKSDFEVDDLILALLQAKGIHRRLRAEMTNTQTPRGV